MGNLETFELSEAQEEAWEWEWEWANSVESKLGVPGSRKFHRLRFIENIIRAEAEERKKRRAHLINPLYRDGKVKCIIDGDQRTHCYVDRKPGKRMVHGIASTPTVNSHKYFLRSSGCEMIFPIPLLVSHEGTQHIGRMKGFGEVTIVRKRF